MDTTSKKTKTEKSIAQQINDWFDKLSPQYSVLPLQTQKPSFSLLQSRWFRLSIVFYIVFCILLTAAHLTAWLFSEGTHALVSTEATRRLSFQRTYDADEPYSLISDMTPGLKFSKLFSKAHYDALRYTRPFWQKATQEPNPAEVTFITTTTPETWKELVQFAKHWNGPISATLHVSKNEETSSMLAEYKSTPELFNHVDLHLVQTPQKTASILIPLNVERNLARIYARSNHVSDIPVNTIIATDLRRTILKHLTEYTELLRKGDMLVIPTFAYNENAHIAARVPQTKKELVGLVEKEKVLGLYDAHFALNQGPTDLDTWKNANDIYKVTQYTMEYEPIVIQSKTVQPWCSERFVDKRSACLLSSYLAGNDFFVLPHDFAVEKPSNQKTLISNLDNVIEKRLYAKFYWEQCVYQGRQLDAMGLWNTAKSNHIRQQCSRIIQNWGRGTYELVVCQQPLHARMCGFGEKDRRPIDPPPIVQLIVKQQGQDHPIDVQMLQIPFFVLHVTLWSDDCSEERNIISNPPKCTRVLMGSLVSSPSLLKNTEGEQGLYFAFPDLSIRTEGRYTLRFSLMKLSNSDFQENAKSKIVAQVFSDPFTVYSAKKNPLNYQKPLQNKV
ncbi:velvet factor-domain-containing protein [Gilbertella persicaria]|uniref:velvet factor-domain-containing protein n=1 Tax=Gilbertella persicaria TaxID=101096 RepID=UPI0022203AF0|nr:velvet factor-domain-containing protein [Gilbertella persicaria]KAI8064265.1 velvet factor-domain-containing protein [Gilbertella persicaria]